ncbi:MAG: hypothetical protein Q6K80_10380 [Thermostichus sp. DG_1_6_bins_120]
MPLTEPPPDAFRVSTPRPPWTDLYPTPMPLLTPTPTPLPTSTPTPAPTVLELSARWLGIPWPPQRWEASLVCLSARFLQISLRPFPVEDTQSQLSAGILRQPTGGCPLKWGETKASQENSPD